VVEIVNLPRRDAPPPSNSERAELDAHPAADLLGDRVASTAGQMATFVGRRSWR
jgi:hypothetical protein